MPSRVVFFRVSLVGLSAAVSCVPPVFFVRCEGPVLSRALALFCSPIPNTKSRAQASPPSTGMLLVWAWDMRVVVAKQDHRTHTGRIPSMSPLSVTGIPNDINTY